MKTEAPYHRSVLLHESTDALNIHPEGVYVDATFGGGGHSAVILNRLGKNGRLIAFDQDEDAQRNMPDDTRLVFVHANFRHLKRFLRLHQIDEVDGILADLGVSSWQFDTASRGFSYRFDGPLDMRMNKGSGRTAADVLNTCDAATLQQLFSAYGEVRNAKSLAAAIVHARQTHPFVTISDLKTLALKHRMGDEHKYLAQIFQALRIEVNDELNALREFLVQCHEVLKPGGRLAVITFHSLEDRLVKNFMKHGAFNNEPQKDLYGNYERKFELITKKPIEPQTEELKSNSRSHSARLRVAKKL